jgi:hypothetical protein
MPMEIRALVRAAAEELEAAVEEEDQVFFLTVVAEEDEDAADDEVASEVVMIYGDDDGETLIASCDVGVCAEDADLSAVLRGLGSVVYSRVYLEPDDDGEHLVVEAGLPMKGLEPSQLAQVVQEVAEVADWLDEFLLQAES